ncbi:hypothetical protein CCYA_CCYA13G3637 [Cyanidiococcus yangmingshanensis]|nr:hypothetical protein CCYA_CCYA13G3637 [Cyanidiococcus yangmingshanensis]
MEDSTSDGEKRGEVERSEGLVATELDDATESPARNTRDPRYPLQTEYAPCGWPPEYCEFHTKEELQSCLPWLLDHYPEWFEPIHPGRGTEAALAETKTYPETLRNGLGDASIDYSAFANYFAELKVTAQERAVERPSVKAPAKSSGGKQKTGRTPEIVIQVSKVKGNKQMTAVYGLGAFIDKACMKDLAKACKKRFSCGATVTRTEAHGETLEIQGDRASEIAEWIRDDFSLPPDRIFFALSGDLKNKQAAF